MLGASRTADRPRRLEVFGYAVAGEALVLPGEVAEPHEAEFDEIMAVRQAPPWTLVYGRVEMGYGSRVAGVLVTRRRVRAAGDALLVSRDASRAAWRGSQAVLGPGGVAVSGEWRRELESLRWGAAAGRYQDAVRYVAFHPAVLLRVLRRGWFVDPFSVHVVTPEGNAVEYRGLSDPVTHVMAVNPVTVDLYLLLGNVDAAAETLVNTVIHEMLHVARATRYGIRYGDWYRGIPDGEEAIVERETWVIGREAYPFLSRVVDDFLEARMEVLEELNPGLPGALRRVGGAALLRLAEARMVGEEDDAAVYEFTIPVKEPVADAGAGLEYREGAVVFQAKLAYPCAYPEKELFRERMMRLRA